MSDFLAVANAAVEAGIAHARQHGLRVAVVVLDATMAPVSVQRLDGSYHSAFAVAVAKARTAVNFGAPTAALAERIVPANQAALANVVDGLMFVAGGVPIVAGGAVVGAVGVSGGSADQDEACAQAAVSGSGTGSGA
ncbi:GlcG/HbpS family heme-binding protein [Pseudonocardia sp. GCM10023141]|uniref:GlcG/HbpS family heme-binding protein n=1 Tax=Pseudonocardia sp. GCM10023141 TaxID=3252653 RepID=UPI00361341DB